MATKRDRKTAFPFIKPKGSIKKDVQQYRKAVMSQNGDEEVRDAMINPVQRRESSAARFLKHFRPDRNNPAYHSEGKGLRNKRRHWNSERQLTPPEATAAAGDEAPTVAPLLQQSTCTASSVASNAPNGGRHQSHHQPQRSHSFSEPDGGSSVIRCNPSGGVSSSPFSSSSKEQQQHNGGVRDSFRWRFRSSRSSSTTNASNAASSSDLTSKGGDTSQKTINDHTVLASSGSHELNHATNGSNWQQPQQQPPTSSDVVEPIYINNNNNSSKNGSPSSASVHGAMAATAGSTYSARVYAAAVCSAADADAIAESDYVNYEVFAAQLNKQQQHLEPDLLRNLPYQQQQQQQQQRTYNNVQQQQFSSPRRHANARSGFSSDEQQQHQQPNGGGLPVFAQRQLSRDAAGLHQPQQDRRLSSNSLTMQPYGPYSRPPAPLPDSALMDGSNSNNSAPNSTSWQWQNNHSTTISVSTVDPQTGDEDESHYASQLRSSMAALLHGHIRQSSTASNSSSTFSSYSDEFNGRAGLQGEHHHHHLLLQQQQQQQQPPQLVHSPTLLGIPDMNGCYGGSPSSPPPPPPPVRDASSLKYVKYGPGHEKHPSWPMPGGGPGNAQGQSQRSKSWTDHTDYPKEPAATYSRPSNTSSTPGCSLSPSALTGGRAYSHQLKTVMENCERIPAEIYQATSVSVELDGTIVAPNYLPTYDCDGRNIDDKDYSIPSPPERDVSGPRMTMVGPSSSSMVGGGGSGTGSAASSGDGGDYAKYEDIQQYSHSEGYSSYVPSESSYVSVSGTPLLDQLRRDSDGLGDGGSNNTKEPGTRDSVSTVVTHSSSSNSSNDTLRWHGSYNDITATSGASGSGCMDTATSALVVHSAKVQAPQRHNSESVLYYENQMTSSSSPSSSAIVTSASASAMKTINRHGGWSQRVERKNQWNANSNSSNRLSASGTYGSDQEACNTTPSSPNGAEPAPLSVAERIHQLEWQSRSVPNLSRSGNDSTSASPQRRSSAQPLALANGGHTISLDPVSPPPPSVALSSSSSSPSPPSPERTAPVPVSSTDLLPQGGQVDPTQKYTFLDPDKRMRVADPTLKAIQKQALLSYYERHAGRSSMANKSPPPPALPRTSSSSSNNMTGANNNSHPLKNDAPGAGVGGGAGASGGGHGSSHSPELGSNAALVAAVAAAVQSESSNRNGLQQQQPQRSGPIPPERPPKKPHLRNHQPAISPDQEVRRIESFSASQEQLNLPSQRSSVASSTSSALPVAATRRKPPAPDPPCSPPKIASSGVPLRSATPDLPPPPPPTVVTEELVTDDPLPPPPPSIVLDEATVNHQSSSSTSSPAPASPLSMYHQESYMVHRAKLHSPTGLNYHRRSSDNLLAETSATPSSWEKHYNVRQNSASTTLIFSSTEALDRTGDNEQLKPQPQQRKSSPTFQTAQPQEPTYRPMSSSNTNAERFAFMRQVSQGRPSTTSANNGNATATTNSKLSDPGPPKSLLELNGNHRAVQHQRSHSDSDSPAVQPPLPSSKPPQVTSAPPPQRLKRPEEVECDQLSLDLIGHLPPSDSRLHALLSVPDPANAAASLRTEGLLQVQLGSASVQQESTTASPPPSLKSPSPPTAAAAVASSTSPIKSNSCAPLPATSAYFTTSEPRAKLLTRYHSSNHILNNNNEDGNNSTTSGTATTSISSAVDSDLLIKKKEELVSRLARKLDVLRSEREAIQEEVESNEQLGRLVTGRVSCVATPAETNKVFLHVAELDKITALLLALAGRLARAQNALHSLPDHAEPQEKIVLEGKRDKLMEQLEEAKRLKENIDRRSRQVADLLSRYLTEEEFADYSHFVTMKAKLVIDQREIDEKIKLGDEQLAALRETLYLGRPRI